MDKIEKALKKLSAKEREVVEEILKRIKSNDVQNLELKKLRGVDDIFRIRKGDIRIIYKKTKDQIFILAIERRSEKTYRDF